MRFYGFTVLQSKSAGCTLQGLLALVTTWFEGVDSPVASESTALPVAGHMLSWMEISFQPRLVS
jgi:hypothetical protein